MKGRILAEMPLLGREVRISQVDKNKAVYHVQSCARGSVPYLDDATSALDTITSQTAKLSREKSAKYQFNLDLSNEPRLYGWLTRFSS